MDDIAELDRRAALRYLAATTTISVAGCISGSNPNQTDSPTSQTTPTTTEAITDRPDVRGNGSTNESATEAINRTASGAGINISTVSGSAAESVTGTSWDVAADGLSAIGERYNQVSDGSVSINKLGNDAVHNQLRTALISGQNAPGFSSILTSEVPSYIESVGGLRDLSSRIESSGLKDEFVSARWPPATGSEGGIYALPWDISPAYLFYRRDIFEEHGIDPASIETHDDFIEEGEKLPNNVAMTNLSRPNLGALWRMYYWQLGGKIFDSNGNVKFANEKSYRIARTLKRQSDAGITSSHDQWSASWFTAFSESSLASLIKGSWMAGTLRAELPDTSGDWGVAKPPAFESGGGRATNDGGTMHMIPSQVDDATANRSWNFLNYTFTNPENQIQLYEISGIFPGLKSAWEHPIMDEEQEFFGGQKTRQVAVKLAPNIPDAYSYSPQSPLIGETMNTELAKMLDGSQGPEAAIDNVANTVADEANVSVV